MASEAIGLGANIVGGLLGRRKPQTTTSTTTGSSMPVFSDYQLGLQKTLNRTLRKLVKEGGQPTQAQRNQAGLQVNENFDALFKRLQNNSVSRGFGDSGKFNLDNQGLEIERANAMQQAEAQLNENALQRQLQILGLSTAPAFASPGQQYSSTTTGTMPGQSFGQALGQGISSAGSDISSWMILQDLIRKSQQQSSAQLPVVNRSLSDLLNLAPPFQFKKP